MNAVKADSNRQLDKTICNQFNGLLLDSLSSLSCVRDTKVRRFQNKGTSWYRVVGGLALLFCSLMRTRIRNLQCCFDRRATRATLQQLML